MTTIDYLRVGLVCSLLIAKALDFALTPTGRLKVGETKLPPIGGEEDTNPPSSPTTKHRASNPPFLSPAVSDAFELLFAFRGIGWDFGQGVHIPHEHRPLERGAFLKATWWIFLKYFLIFDFLHSCMMLIPGVGSPFGGSIFFPLPTVQRYAVSTTIHLMTGTMLLSGFETVYALMTLIGVGLFHQSPLLWPPPLDHPFSSDSLTAFWAKRWHQLLRRLFVIFGGYPGYWIGAWISKEFAKVTMLFGVFTASGLYHELTTYTMGRGFDNNVTLFFVFQAVAALGERVWYKTTGKKVEGWIGLLWVYFCIMVLGQPCGEHPHCLPVLPIRTNHEPYSSRRLAPSWTWWQHPNPKIRQPDPNVFLAGPSKSPPRFRISSLNLLYHISQTKRLCILPLPNQYPRLDSCIYPHLPVYLRSCINLFVALFPCARISMIRSARTDAHVYNAIS